MDRFVTLMRREWMQHRTGWLVLMALPAALMLVLSLFEGRGVHVSVDGEQGSLPPIGELPLVLQTLGWTVATLAVTGVLAGLAVLAQLPGLARRDVQDRSIEFWRSLPIGDGQSLAATVLMHLLVLPGAALVVAVLAGQAVALLAITVQQGPLAWLAQPWWALLPALLAITVRSLLGLLLAVAWLSPLLLMTMAASAWLKRWALPVLAALLLLGVHWLDPRLAEPLVQPALQRVANEALNALLPANAFAGRSFEAPADLAAAVPELGSLLLRDGAQALGNAASPALALALAVAVAGFGLLVLRRQHAH